MCFSRMPLTHMTVKGILVATTEQRCKRWNSRIVRIICYWTGCITFVVLFKHLIKTTSTTLQALTFNILLENYLHWLSSRNIWEGIEQGDIGSSMLCRLIGTFLSFIIFTWMTLFDASLKKARYTLSFHHCKTPNWEWYKVLKNDSSAIVSQNSWNRYKSSRYKGSLSWNINSLFLYRCCLSWRFQHSLF